MIQVFSKLYTLYKEYPLTVFLHGNIMKGVADLTSPYKNLADHLAPLATIMLGEMSLSDVEQFTLTLNATTAQHLRPHIWLVSEQFLVSFVDLYGVLPGFYNHKFICYHSPPKHKAGQGAQVSLYTIILLPNTKLDREHR